MQQKRQTHQLKPPCQKKTISLKSCRFCSKQVPSSEIVIHQTNCQIKQQSRVRQPQQQMRHIPQQKNNQRQQFNRYQEQTIEISSDENSNSSDEEYGNVVDFNQIFGQGSQFQQSMNQMSRMVNQANNAFNINLRFNDQNFSMNVNNIQNFGNFGIQIITNSYDDEDDQDDSDEYEYEYEETVEPKKLNRQQVKQIPTVKYNGNKQNKNCVVCMTDFKKNDIVKILHCSHQFHGKCIDDWLICKAECPMCRCEI